MKNLLRVLGALFVVVALAGVVHATVWTMPTLPPVGQTTVSSNQMGVVNVGGSAITGSVVVTAIGTPSAPVLSTNGTAGSTSIVYACTAVDINGNATIPSSTATIATANATLSKTNSVNITCPGKAGAIGFLVHKVDTSHVLGICYSIPGTSCTFVDDGTVATTFTYTPNTVDATGFVTAGAGSTRSWVTGGTTTVLSSTSVEVFTPISGNSIATLVAATEGDAMQVVPYAMTCKNLRCNSTTIAGALVACGGTSWTPALDDNTVATALTCTCATAATSCTDTTHTVAVAAGDMLDFGWTPAGTPTAVVPHCTMECDY